MRIQNSEVIDMTNYMQDQNFNQHEVKKEVVLNTAAIALKSYYEILSDRVEGIINYTNSGLNCLDDGFPGLFHNGHLIVIAARPAMGKSALNQQIAENMSEDKTVVYFNLEMTDIEMIERSLARRATVDLRKLHVSPEDLDDDDLSRLTIAGGEISRSNIIIEDQIFNIDEIMDRCRLIQEIKADTEAPLGAIFIDYLQLISSSDNNNRNAQVGAISRSLKLLAKSLKLPVILLSQLSRDVEKRQDKRPLMSDLRDSGEIEQNADSIMFVYRDEVYNEDGLKGAVELLVRKNRSGATGDVFADWKGRYMQFSDRSDG